MYNIAIDIFLRFITTKKHKCVEKGAFMHVMRSILATILFLDMFYDEVQLIILAYDNTERRGFLQEDHMYYTVQDQVARYFRF